MGEHLAGAGVELGQAIAELAAGGEQASEEARGDLGLADTDVADDRDGGIRAATTRP